MAVKKTKPKFETTDGREFEDQRLAKRHEELTQAKYAFESSRKAFGVALARTQLTADGKQFSFGWRDYFYIADCWSGLPSILAIQVYEYAFDFTDQDDELVLLVTDHRIEKQQRYKIGDLYVDKREAEKALAVAEDKRMKSYAEQIRERREQAKTR